MSTEYDLHCKDCNKHVEVGCVGFSGRQFPYLNKKIMENMRDFLWEHEKHHLVWEADFNHEDSIEVNNHE